MKFDNCGTYAGYKRHRYYKDLPCEECKTASRNRTRLQRSLNIEKYKEDNKKAGRAFLRRKNSPQMLL